MPIVTLDRMVALYGASMRLSWSARAFLSKAEGLKRMALNAEVAAQHTGQRSPVFHILAKEIGSLTAEARAVVGDLQAQAERIAAKAIRSAASARRAERYRASLTKGLQGINEQRIRDRLRVVVADLDADFASVREALSKTETGLGELHRLHLQLPMIASMLRIEAHRDAVIDHVMAEHAKALVTLRNELTASLDQAQADSKRTVQLLFGDGDVPSDRDGRTQEKS